MGPIAHSYISFWWQDGVCETKGIPEYRCLVHALEDTFLYNLIVAMFDVTLSLYGTKYWIGVQESPQYGYSSVANSHQSMYG